MKKQLAWVVSASVLSLLGACGGGSDADLIDKYVGTWSQCSGQGAGSRLDTVVFTKTSASAGGFTYLELNFDLPNCTGASSPNEEGSATFTIAGTKSIGGKEGDKILGMEGSDSFKQVFYVSNGTLTIGLSSEDGGTQDVEGFPNEFEATSSTKK